MLMGVMKRFKLDWGVIVYIKTHPRHEEILRDIKDKSVVTMYRDYWVFNELPF